MELGRFRKFGLFALVLGSSLAWFSGQTVFAEEADSTRKTVAVLYYDNHTGQDRYDPLGKGLASMMISDLSGVEYIQLVEREHLESLIRELELQQSDLFDPDKALQVGQFVGAEYVVMGSITAVQPDIRLDSRVIQVETSEIVKTAQVTGEEGDLFQLQTQLADALVEGLDLALSPEACEQLRATQEANRIDDIETALAFSEALEYYDHEQYVEALERMDYVRKHAPASKVVALAYEAIMEDMKKKGERALRDKVNKGLRRLLGKG